jgi:tetraacyldisaccharide 4'-kinase
MSDPTPSPPRPPGLFSPEKSRSPWQLFYAGVHSLRVRWWRRRAKKLPRPVISIGNLHWGGAGKTPATIAIAAELRGRGYSVAVLSRGYGSQGGGVRIVSRGDGPLLGPKIAGDEPVLLAGQLPGVAVVVCPDRYRAGMAALDRLDKPPDLFLLDDGFSHLQLHRDLDLLVFPAADPFAGGKLAPGGRLREPLSSSRRAQAALLTGEAPEGGDGLPAMAQQLARALRSFGFAGPAFAAPTVAARPLPDLALPGKKALVVSGIARPESFLRTVERQGIEVADVLSYPDHFRYPDAAIAELRAHFAKSGADFLLVTSKDMVKLRGRIEAPLAELPIACRPEDAFFTWLESRLAELRPPRG